MAEAAAEKPWPGALGGEAVERKELGDQEQGSSIVSSGGGVVSGISQHSVPLVWPEVKPDVRPGERRAMAVAR